MMKQRFSLLGCALTLFMLLFAQYASAQVLVKGTVSEENGDPLIGASVIIKGELSGTTTDIDGNYSLSVPESNKTLVFSFIGYESKEELVANRSQINVILSAKNEGLEEVIVVGYGTQKRVTMTGAVAQIDSEELNKAPMQNVSNMLTGKIPGLTSIQSSGKPGADGAALYIRGVNSFRGNNGPMVIVDGVPRPLNYVNPNDIESISVLKDASAAIYGVQGANGVILITTKAGNEGAPKIQYDYSYTLTENTAMPEMLNAPDYMYWHNKAREMDNLSPLWTADIQNRVLNSDENSIWGQTNWLDKIFQFGETQQHNISATGGNEKTKYFTSIGYMDQEGTLINTNFRRFNIRANLDIKVARNLKFITNLSAYRYDRSWPGTAIENQGEFNPIRQAITSIPIIKSEYNGLPTAWKGSTYNVNGYAALTESGFKKQSHWHFDSNFKLEYDLVGLNSAFKGLKASMFAAYNYSNTLDSNYDRYYELYYVNTNKDEGVSGASGYSKDGAYSKSASMGDTYLLRPQINYNREFNRHSVNALLFYEAQKSYGNTMTGAKRGYYSDDPVDLTLGTTFADTPVTGSHFYSGQASWAGRFNYAFDKKYLAEFTFRRDGSYVFAPENRWGFFPSASLGWVVSQEDFFSNALPFIDYFKIRASYGQSGSDHVTPYLYNSTYAIANNSMVLGNQPISQFYSSNPYIYRNLTWATTHSYNLGLEFNMWDSKLAVELDLFYKLTEDILETQSGNYPSSLGGYYPSYQNSGKVDNKGFELTLKHNNRINSDWSYGLSANLSFARNRILAKAVTDSYASYQAVIGESIYARHGYIALGLFQSQDEIDNYPAAPSGHLRPGDLKYLDVNGDGIISDRYDYVKTGYGAVPEISFSLNMNLSYKNFYATALWQGVTHCDYELSGVYNSGVTSSTVYTTTFPEGGNSPYYRIENAWTPENTNAKYPRLSTVSNGNNAWRSSWWVINGEYLRLKNASIGYNLPERLMENSKWISGAKIYLAGTNLLTFSHFKYVDPESPSVSNGYYPQQKTYSIGVNVTF